MPKSSLHLISPVPIIESNRNSIQVQHDQNSDRIVSLGKQDWELALSNPLGGYGMFCENRLFDIDKNHFIVVQTYEHSRGGHVDNQLNFISKNGNLLWSYYGYACDMNQFVIDHKKIWFLHRDFRKIGIQLNTWPKKEIAVLTQIDQRTGNTDFQSGLTFPHDKNSIEDNRAIWAKFQDKNQSVHIVFHYFNYINNKMVDKRKLAVPFENYVRKPR